MQSDGHGAGALTKKRDPVRISAKLSDVVVHPFKSQALVHEAVVAREPIYPRKEAEHTNAIVDRDDDHLACGSEVARVVKGIAGCALPE